MNVDSEKPKEGTNMTSIVEPELGLLQVARVRVFGAEGRFDVRLQYVIFAHLRCGLMKT